jgi:DNA polymerase III subunit delta'
MQHPDLTLLQADKVGGTLKVELVREAQHVLSLLPYEANYRVALLLRFEEANPSAQNALLKTLEEAPARVILLLTAESAESVLPTIASRCETLRLRPMPLNLLQEALSSRGIDADAARFLAHLSGGRLGYALQQIETPDQLHMRQTYINEMIEVLGENYRGRIEYADRIYRDRPELRLRMASWLSIWRDVMLRSAGKKLVLTNIDYEEGINALAGHVTLAEARKQVENLERAVARLDSNLNARLLVEVTLFDWPQVHLVKGDLDE